MAFAGMNYFAVLIAALAAYARGTLFYMTLSKQWLAAVGLTQARRSAAPFVTSLLTLLFIAIVLWWKIGLWAGFVATTVFVNNAYPGRKYMLSIIDSAHWLGVLVIQGAVLGAMGV
jgi:hypothetical protein